jgi:hypothetical protein
VIGAELHTVLRTNGRWSDSGDWVSDGDEEFTIYGCLYQPGSADLMLDPNGARVASSAWILLPDVAERDLIIAADGVHGDRVYHGDAVLTVVGSQEYAGVGGLPTRGYHLTDRGQDPGGAR